uniref:Uncharacterized protein n=1 Tax=Tanacetum cinerariifolium TaxID=118510 RepID=A0A6L2LW92_TANCI|nr:hypothetical protein [Tanacetum cinerariifolium]
MFLKRKGNVPRPWSHSHQERHLAGNIFDNLRFLLTEKCVGPSLSPGQIARERIPCKLSSVCFLRRHVIEEEYPHGHVAGDTRILSLEIEGNTIHCSAKATVSHNILRLKEGGIFSMEIFADKPNKDEYRILKNNAYMLEFNRSTTIRKASVKADGFVGYSFQLQDFDGIESLDNKYLIDVVEYVTNVGRTNHLKSGSRNLDFHLTNHKLLFFADIPLIPYGHKDNMSSTSSTVIYDDEVILAIKTSGTSVDLSQPWAGTLENLLMWAWNRKNDVYCFLPILFLIYHSSITPNLQRLSLQSIIFHYKSLEDYLNLPPALSNLIGTASVMEIKSHTFYKYGTFESFTCWQILLSEGIDDSVGSNNLDDYADNQPQKMKRIVQDPSIFTLSKPVEERKKSRMDVEDSETEDSSDSANAKGKKEVVEPSA